jgi:predicted nucleic acid-binding protein
LIVIDASALVEYLLQGAAAAALQRRFLEPAVTLHAPHLIDVEILHVLRKQALRGAITGARGQLAVQRLAALRLARYPHEKLLARIWSLRHNVSAYDAAYIALAGSLDAPLLTLDRGLAASVGHRAHIELV